MKILKLNILMLSILLLSCTNSDDDNIDNENTDNETIEKDIEFVKISNPSQVIGSWKLDSIYSKEAFDLNNDGIQNTYLFNEIEDCDIDNLIVFDVRPEATLERLDNKVKCGSNTSDIIEC